MAVNNRFRSQIHSNGRAFQLGYCPFQMQVVHSKCWKEFEDEYYRCRKARRNFCQTSFNNATLAGLKIYALVFDRAVYRLASDNLTNANQLAELRWSLGEFIADCDRPLYHPEVSSISGSDVSETIDRNAVDSPAHESLCRIRTLTSTILQRSPKIDQWRKLGANVGRTILLLDSWRPESGTRDWPNVCGEIPDDAVFGSPHGQPLVELLPSSDLWSKLGTLRAFRVATNRLSRFVRMLGELLAGEPLTPSILILTSREVAVFSTTIDIGRKWQLLSLLWVLASHAPDPVSNRQLHLESGVTCRLHDIKGKIHEVREMIRPAMKERLKSALNGRNEIKECFIRSAETGGLKAYRLDMDPSGWIPNKRSCGPARRLLD